MEALSDIERAKRLVQSGDPDAAFDILDEILKENPNDVPSLLMATSIMDKARRLTAAYQYAKRVAELAPNSSASWTNLGRISGQLYQDKEAESAFKRAIELSNKPRERTLCYSNLAGHYVTAGRWEEGKRLALKAIELDENNHKAHGNLGIAKLALGEWHDGWEHYGHILGSEYRKLIKYRAKDEPEWKGETGSKVVVYGEQGLGDELSFASMIPDAVKRAGRVIIDCDERLEGLFKRSFPGAKVYGTRWKKEAQWDEEDQNPEHSISVGQLGTIFRTKASDFDGEPYLIPEKERHFMWYEYFKTKHKPVIGIAWSGGLDWTGKRYRKWDLKQLQPIFDAVDAHWVCLQYKDATAEIEAFKGAQIHQYKFATLSKDYDDTAGLVSACDLVICMQTSVGHLAAAMGVETWAFVNSKAPQWRYGTLDRVPWYKAMGVFRQRADGSWPIDEAARVLKLRYSQVRAA